MKFQNGLRLGGFTALMLFIFCFRGTNGECQTIDSTSHLGNSSHDLHASGGVEVGYGSRTDGFHGIFFRFFYEAQIDRTFLNAGAFTYQKINDGFGFDFRLSFPFLFYPSGSHTNFAPHIGVGFDVWPVYKPTVSVGFPIGINYELPIENFPNISVGANAAPLINLSSEKNTFIFDVRLGIRFD